MIPLPQGGQERAGAGHIVLRGGADGFRRLATQRRGDLDWIVMKRLEKDRTRRYETANGLTADLHRHLNDEAVAARWVQARQGRAKQNLPPGSDKMRDTLEAQGLGRLVRAGYARRPFLGRCPGLEPGRAFSAANSTPLGNSFGSLNFHSP